MTPEEEQTCDTTLGALEAPMEAPMETPLLRPWSPLWMWTCHFLCGVTGRSPVAVTGRSRGSNNQEVRGLFTEETRPSQHTLCLITTQCTSVCVCVCLCVCVCVCVSHLQECLFLCNWVSASKSSVKRYIVFFLIIMSSSQGLWTEGGRGSRWAALGPPTVRGAAGSTGPAW